VQKHAPVSLELSKVKFGNHFWATWECIVAQQWFSLLKPIIKQWDIRTYYSNSYIKTLLKDTDVQQWFRTIFMQDWPTVLE
jgi:hypothetical protein